MSAEAFHVEALIFVVILVIYVLTSHIIENRKIPFVHESSIAIIMGIVTSVISKYVPNNPLRPSARRSTSAMNSSLHSSCLPSSSQPDTPSENLCFSKISE
jgi:hypothetical protein